MSQFAEIKSIKDIRFHTRYPVIFPERIDKNFLETLNWSKGLFRTVSIAIHSNHIKEIDQSNERVIKELSELNIQLLSQTVLLKGVNDSGEDLINLFNRFIDLKIRPYYLHHPDPVKGGMHFYLPLKRGRELYQALRKELPGWALPHYVIDIPGGFGKVSAYNPETTTFSGQLISKDGSLIKLKEPDLFV